MLVYEPEAAALYCRFQNMQNISNAKDESNLSKEKKMLVFDMGGKTLLFIVINISNSSIGKGIHDICLIKFLPVIFF